MEHILDKERPEDREVWDRSNLDVTMDCCISEVNDVLWGTHVIWKKVKSPVEESKLCFCDLRVDYLLEMIQF